MAVGLLGSDVVVGGRCVFVGGIDHWQILGIRCFPAVFSVYIHEAMYGLILLLE